MLVHGMPRELKTSSTQLRDQASPSAVPSPSGLRLVTPISP